MKKKEHRHVFVKKILNANDGSKIQILMCKCGETLRAEGFNNKGKRVMMIGRFKGGF